MQVSKSDKRRGCDLPNQEREVLITTTIVDNNIGPQVVSVGLIVGLNLSILIINLGVVNVSFNVYWLSLMVRV